MDLPSSLIDCSWIPFSLVAYHELLSPLLSRREKYADLLVPYFWSCCLSRHFQLFFGVFLLFLDIFTKTLCSKCTGAKIYAFCMSIVNVNVNVVWFPNPLALS